MNKNRITSKCNAAKSIIRQIYSKERARKRTSRIRCVHSERIPVSIQFNPTCASCSRRLPLAAVRCPWCRLRVSPFTQIGLPEGERHLANPAGYARGSAAQPSNRQTSRS